MTNVQIKKVLAEDADIRLDRWFKRHFPQLGHGRLEKLLRTGQVRLDGKRAGAGDRVAAGQEVRVPPLPDDGPLPKPTYQPKPQDIAQIERAILYRDDDVIAIDKPPGLAVQGGTATEHHLDAMLDGLRFGAAERPRLVHRLDKDTSGVLVLARSAAAARFLTAAFRDKDTQKIYWAAVVGSPKPRQGRIDKRLAKLPGPAGERVVEDEEGKRAVTDYRTIAHAGDKIAWVALNPLTGRTHQLRAHLAAIGAPVLGDGKYGGAAAHPAGIDDARKLHLHARALALPRPGGGALRIVAPLPPHMKRTWKFFGFDESDERDPFAGFADRE
ncbi:MAG TPA: RluA family pseudouridine synthase [Stellaceae bacterium]|nr:RluA family pseudouridine synthase [Stellaceae bacterium]